MEHQGPDLDTLSRQDVLADVLVIHESAVRRRRSSTLVVRPALEHHRLVLVHVTKVVPPMLVRVLNLERLPLGRRRLIQQPRRDEVRVLDAPRVDEGEGRVEDGPSEGAPEVDQLRARGEQAIRVGSEVPVDALAARGGRLVNVDAGNGLAGGGRVGGFVTRSLDATDRVVEDLDSGRSRHSLDKAVGLFKREGIRFWSLKEAKERDHSRNSLVVIRRADLGIVVPVSLDHDSLGDLPRDDLESRHVRARLARPPCLHERSEVVNRLRHAAVLHVRLGQARSVVEAVIGDLTCEIRQSSEQDWGMCKGTNRLVAR